MTNQPTVPQPRSDDAGLQEEQAARRQQRAARQEIEQSRGQRADEARQQAEEMRELLRSRLQTRGTAAQAAPTPEPNQNPHADPSPQSTSTGDSSTGDSSTGDSSTGDSSTRANAKPRGLLERLLGEPDADAAAETSKRQPPAPTAPPTPPSPDQPRESTTSPMPLRARIASIRCGADRLIGQLSGLIPGRGKRVVVACPGAFPSPAANHLAWEARHLLEGGLDVRFLTWSTGRITDLDSSERAMLRRCQTLSDEERTHQQARGYWAKRNPTMLAQVEGWLAHSAELLPRLYSFARAAANLKPGYLHGFGTGDSAVLTRGAARLLAVPYGITVTGSEAGLPHADPELRATVLREAAVVVVDCAETAETVLAMTGDSIEHLAIKAPAVYWEPLEIPMLAASTRVRALVAPPIHPDELLQLTDALKQVVDGGGDLEIVMLGHTGTGSDTARDSLWQRLEQHSLESRFALPVEDDVTPLREHVSQAAFLLALHGHGARREHAGLGVAVLAAMAAGVPIVAHRGGALDGVVHDWEEGVLVPPGDTRTLARVLARLCADGVLRQQLGKQAQSRFAAEFAPDNAGTALRQRLRELVGGGKPAASTRVKPG